MRSTEVDGSLQAVLDLGENIPRKNADSPVELCPIERSYLMADYNAGLRETRDTGYTDDGGTRLTCAAEVKTGTTMTDLQPGTWLNAS